MRTAVYFFIILIISGCTYRTTINQGILSNQTIFTPSLNEISQVSLGERMMYKANGWYIDCISPKITKSEKFNLGVLKVEIIATQELCGDREGTNKFYAPYKILLGSSIVYDNEFIVEVRKADGTIDLCWNGFSIYCVNYKNNEIMRETRFKSEMGTIQQSMEYMGRNGDILKFLYTEFYNGLARPAFNREFVVDLNLSNTLNFSGAEVEIINASNTILEYKITKYFD